MTNVHDKTDFLVLPCRQAACQQLDDFLHLRQWRRANPEGNEAQLYGGLGGMILEGPPAAGKSDLVTHRLLAHGYQEVTLESEVIPEKAFYRMPVSMQLLRSICNYSFGK